MCDMVACASSEAPYNSKATEPSEFVKQFYMAKSRVSSQRISLPIPPFKIPLDFCVEKCPRKIPEVHWSFDFTSVEFCQKKNASKNY